MPRPHTHRDFKDENGAPEPFSGSKPGTELGKVQSSSSHSRINWDLTGADIEREAPPGISGRSHTKYLTLPQKAHLHSRCC